MASENSFDVVSKVDHQEVDNALNQAAKEIRNRFDFKGTDSQIRWSGETVEMESSSEEKIKAIWDVFQSKLVKRGVSLKAVKASDPRISGKTWRMDASLSEGISTEDAKKVKCQIQGDELRVSSKKRDDLQAVQRLILDQDYDFAVQFTNYR